MFKTIRGGKRDALKVSEKRPSTNKVSFIGEKVKSGRVDVPVDHLMWKLDLLTGIVWQVTLEDDFELGTPFFTGKETHYPNKKLIIKKDHLYCHAPNRDQSIVEFKKKLDDAAKKGTKSISPF